MRKWMGRWFEALVIPLSALMLAGGSLPVAAVGPVRVGTAIHPLAPRNPSAGRVQGIIQPGSAGAVGPGRFRDGAGRFGDVGIDGEDLGYGLAGGFVGGNLSRSADDADGPFPYGAPTPLGVSPPGGPFPGARRPATPMPCVRPQIITIGRGVRSADKVRVVYGASSCGS